MGMLPPLSLGVEDRLLVPLLLLCDDDDRSPASTVFRVVVSVVPLLVVTVVVSTTTSGWRTISCEDEHEWYEGGSSEMVLRESAQGWRRTPALPNGVPPTDGRPRVRGGRAIRC